MPLVWCGLGLARLAILTLPFARYRGALGTPSNNLGATGTDVPRQDTVTRIGKLVRGVARLTPWTSNCLPQALVAALLLRGASIPYVVHLGMRRDAAQDDREPELLAHAWTLVGPQAVTGGREANGMTPVATFTWRIAEHVRA
ncbi:lasso peptide biosynthesis B2 protein [Gymnodinialimonas sp.]